MNASQGAGVHCCHSRYQRDYSRLHPGAIYHTREREAKAQKILAVLQDYYGEKLSTLNALDIGCGAGIITGVLGAELRSITGVDIDRDAITYAREKCVSPNVAFELQDCLALDFDDASFDLVICNHVYEHTSDATEMMAEASRCLKPGGICYFSADNRLWVMEPHYGLPFLSWLPRPLADAYVAFAGRGRTYYENPRTLWGLKRLVSQFEVIDYTRRFIRDPRAHRTEDKIRPGSFTQKIALFAADHFYYLLPGYIWLLRKPAG